MDGPQIQYNNSVCVLAHSVTPGCPPDCPGTFLGSGLDLGGDHLRTHEAEIVLNSCFVTKQSGRMKWITFSIALVLSSEAHRPQQLVILTSHLLKTLERLVLAYLWLQVSLLLESLALCRPLRVFGVQRELLKPFYDSMVASAFFYGVVCWSSSFSSGHRKKLNRLYFGVASRPAERRNSLNQFARAWHSYVCDDFFARVVA